MRLVKGSRRRQERLTLEIMTEVVRAQSQLSARLPKVAIILGGAGSPRHIVKMIVQISEDGSRIEAPPEMDKSGPPASARRRTLHLAVSYLRAQRDVLNALQKLHFPSHWFTRTSCTKYHIRETP
jgi:hypothetical protein